MDTKRIAHRFPLVARPRPACLPIDQRVRDIGELARKAASDPGDQCLSLAAAAHNKAALIASDCGLPELARSLCWRQFDLYTPARPFDATAARHALEPLINLARLKIRSSNPDNAYQLLDTLFRGVKSRKDAMVDGRQLPFKDFTGSDDDHRALCQWLWTVLLAEGTRALVAAGRWRDAVTHTELHKGIGHRLLDGRQIAVLALCLDGDANSALTLLSESQPTEPWEHAVLACLTVLCLTIAERPANAALTDATRCYFELDTAPGLAVFRTRLGLTIADLATDLERPLADQITEHLVNDILANRDGYAARDLLNHDACRSHLSSAGHESISETVRGSGLGLGSIPESLMAELLTSVETSETTTTRELNLVSR